MHHVPAIIVLKVFNFIPVIDFGNTSATFFSVSKYSKRMLSSFISSCINWNFYTFQSLMNDCVFFLKLDWLSQWIVVEFLSDSSSVSALRQRTSWLANEIAINSTLHVDKVTEFCFLDFHEIIRLFSVNLKQNPLTLFFCHVNYPNPSHKTLPISGVSVIS